MRPLHQQLRDAWKASGKTLEQLATLAKLEMTMPSLSRKLSGDQILSTEECEAIAQALGINLVWAPKDKAS